MNATPPRSGAIDLLRALLVLYVVAYLHLGSYIGDGQRHVTYATVAVTNVVLGTFTFLSGYLLGAWKGGRGAGDLGRFYARRLVRIYPLYLLALAGFVALWLVDVPTAVKAAFAVSMFWPEPPMTLWFVTMIIVCYLLAPALVMPSPRRGLAVAVALWLAMLLFHFTVHPIDARMLTQFAAFAAGVSCRRFGLRTPARLPIGALAVAFALALAAAVATLPQPLAGAVVAVPSVIAGPLLLLAVADRHCGSLSRHRAIVFLSHVSFAAYLFHRIVFGLVHRFAWPASEPAQLAVLLGVGLPCVLIASALIQSGYDRLVDALAGLRATSTWSSPRPR